MMPHPTEVIPPRRRRPKLLDRVRDEIRARHYSPRTSRSYVGWIRRFIHFSGLRHPNELGSDDVRRYLTYLAVDRNVSPSTQNQALSALLFLYKRVLRIDLPWLNDVVRAKRQEKIPVVLTRDEIRRVLDRLNGTPWLLAA